MNTQRSDLAKHPIRVVSKRTGLTAEVLRAWEKRYGVVVPARTEGGQRLYSDADVGRLSLLHRAVEEGRSISQVAGLPTEELEQLVQEDEEARHPTRLPKPMGENSPARVLEEAQRAVIQMDSQALHRILTRSALDFSVPMVVDGVIQPLLFRIGSAWESGRVGPAHEHLATVVIRRFLEWLLATVDVGGVAPVMVSGTPAGERHELGALLSAVSGAAEGWRGIFLGPDLPAGEVVAAALRLKAEVVALSCVEPQTAQALPGEVQKIREQLPSDVRLLLGGPLAVSMEAALRGVGVEVLHSFQELRENLRGFGSRSGR